MVERIMGETESPIPPLPVKGADARSDMYATIAKVHRQLVEGKWRARTAGADFRFQPAPVILHCEESIAFLAEELLGLRMDLESFMSVMDPGGDKT